MALQIARNFHIRWLEIFAWASGAFINGVVRLESGLRQIA
jgi:hypothetical protein